MFFEITQPDGSIVHEGPREIGMARIWASFSKDLLFVIRMMDACVVGETFEFGKRIWKRIK